MTQEALTDEEFNEWLNAPPELRRDAFDAPIAAAVKRKLASLSASLTQAREALKRVRAIVEPYAQDGIVVVHFEQEEWDALRDIAKKLGEQT